VEFGLKLGANIQGVSGSDTTIVHDYKPGITGGFFVGMYKKKVGVRIEVLAATSRYTFRTLTDSLGNKADFRAIFLDIPIMFEYRVSPKFMIMAGPQYNSLLSIKATNDFAGDVKALLKQGEFAATIGVEGKVFKNISVGGRYVYGFTNLNNNDATTDVWKTSTIHLYAAYSIK